MSIAAPVRDDHDSVVAALSIEAHTAMISPNELLQKLGVRLGEIADGMSLHANRIDKNDNHK